MQELRSRWTVSWVLISPRCNPLLALMVTPALSTKYLYKIINITDIKMKKIIIIFCLIFLREFRHVASVFLHFGLFPMWEERNIYSACSINEICFSNTSWAWIIIHGVKPFLILSQFCFVFFCIRSPLSIATPNKTWLWFWTLFFILLRLLFSFLLCHAYINREPLDLSVNNPLPFLLTYSWGNPEIKRPKFDGFPA